MLMATFHLYKKRPKYSIPPLITGLNNVCACAKIKSNFRANAREWAANVMCGSFMFSCMTTTGKRQKFSIILAPKRKYIPLMMWKMTI